MPLLDDLPRAGAVVADPDLHWEPWHPAELAPLLSGLAAPWYVAGGWALDLHRSAQTRKHADVEIGVPATAFGEVRQALAGYTFEVAGGGMLWPLDSPAFAATYQTWVSEPDPERPRGRVYRLDVFREPARNGRWAFRRDERLYLTYDQVICRDAAGIPYLAPELALLFKASMPGPKDEADFAAMLPLLTAGSRGRLRRMLDQVHPGHAWIGAL